MTDNKIKIKNNFCLESIFLYPENDEKIKKVIILLHGYGGDARDISALSYGWKRYLKNTLIICPNGHERCSVSPTGFQWFDLTRDDPNLILKSTLEAEKKLNLFLSEIKKEFNLSNHEICISGFSQGCMMAINLGLTSSEKFSCIVGFSGKIIDVENLSTRLKSKSNILLIHGDSDEVVTVSNLLEAKDFMLRNKIDVKTKIIENCGHNIPVSASSIALEYIKKYLITN